MTYIYVLAVVFAIGIARNVSRRLARYSLFALPVIAVGCGDGPIVQADGGVAGGGGATSTTMTHGSGGVPTAGHDPCFDIHDCDESSLLSGTTCMGVACDPTGQMTDPKSNVHGCYLESVDYLSPCPLGSCSGFCQNINGANTPPYACVPDPHADCDAGI